MHWREGFRSDALLLPNHFTTTIHHFHYYHYHYNHKWVARLFQKSREDWGYNFQPPSFLKFLDLWLFTLRNSRENHISPLVILWKCMTPIGNSMVKNSCIKINIFFLDEHLQKFHFNSNPGISTCLLLNKPGNSMSSTPHRMFGFFSGIAQANYGR